MRARCAPSAAWTARFTHHFPADSSAPRDDGASSSGLPRANTAQVTGGLGGAGLSAR